MPDTHDPRVIALAAHGNYYFSGSYDNVRLLWSIHSFLSDRALGDVLEGGCGDGALLQLLAELGINFRGVDASSSGIERCLSRGLPAHCPHVSTDGLPFPKDSFNFVVCLKSFEHLMNPYFGLQEIRRELRPGGRFICSIPNPHTGHPYLYPGLFEYKNFRLFLEQTDFVIGRIEHWQWAPREAILPGPLRRFPILKSRLIAGRLRRLIERAFRILGIFPTFSYWLGTFDCHKQEGLVSDIYAATASRTRSGSARDFSSTTGNSSAITR